MSNPQIRDLARRLNVLERARLQAKQPNLGYSTIDTGAIQAVDQDENLTMIIGQQFDGTNTASVVTGPTPPTPIVPYVVAQPGALRIYWDGTFDDALVAPMDFARVLAYAEPSSTYTGPEPLNQALIVGQFTSATGAELTAALDPGVEYVVYLVTWTQAGKYSLASGAATATVGVMVDAADLEEKSTVYRQATPPWANGAGGHSDDIGDLWFDTTLGPGQAHSVSLKSLTSNVATLTTEDDHGLQVGNSVAVTINDAVFDGTFTVTAITATTFSYAKVNANVAEVAAEGSIQGQAVQPLNRPYIWDGSNWISVQDSDISAVTTLVNGAISLGNSNAADIVQTQAELDTLATTALDAQQTAYAADGRISISDYEPSPSDVAGKQEGSMWITRTRDRVNECINPSFEADTAGWSVQDLAIVRTAVAPAGDGSWAGRITNNGSAVQHYTYLTSALSVAPGEEIAVSAYLKSISGGTTGYYVFINWFNGGTPISTTSSLVTGEINTDDWTRMWATGAAPDNTTHAYIGVLSTAANAGAVWDLDAVLVERSGRLGRYFDGGSEGGEWLGTEENSASHLDGNAIIRFFTLEDGAWTEKFWTADTIASLDASVIDRGEMNGGFLADNSVSVDKRFVVDLPCSENIAAGEIVNVWNNNGVFMVRRAKAEPGFHAHGFALDTVTTGQELKVYHEGYNPLLSALIPGTQFLSKDSGKVSSTPPTDVGTIVQRIGFAPEATTLNFAAGTVVSIT